MSGARAQGSGAQVGGRPLYRHLAAELARRIEAGELAPGEALLPERRLAEVHGVSRVTVRQALGRLARDGLVEQRRGSGTYVADRVMQPLSVLTGLSEDVAARGMAAASRVIRCGSGPATREEARALGLAPGAVVGRLLRLRSAAGMALAVEDACAIAEALPDPAAVDESLYAALAAREMRPVRAVQRLSAVALDAELAAALEAEPGAPGLHIVRIGYTAGGRAVEYTRSTFRGDRWTFETEMTG